MTPPNKSISFSSTTDFPTLLRNLLKNLPEPALIALFAFEMVQVIKQAGPQGLDAIDFITFKCEGESLVALHNCYPDVRPGETVITFGYYESSVFKPQFHMGIEWHPAKGGVA